MENNEIEKSMDTYIRGEFEKQRLKLVMEGIHSIQLKEIKIKAQYPASRTDRHKNAYRFQHRFEIETEKGNKSICFESFYSDNEKDELTKVSKNALHFEDDVDVIELGDGFQLKNKHFTHMDIIKKMKLIRFLTNHEYILFFKKSGLEKEFITGWLCGN